MHSIIYLFCDIYFSCSRSDFLLFLTHVFWMQSFSSCRLEVKALFWWRLHDVLVKYLISFPCFIFFPITVTSEEVVVSQEKKKFKKKKNSEEAVRYWANICAFTWINSLPKIFYFLRTRVKGNIMAILYISSVLTDLRVLRLQRNRDIDWNDRLH